MLETKGYETFLPTYKKRYTYPTRFKESELPLFPGYVFCRFNALSRLPLLTTPGVISILGTGRTPVPVDETEIVSLQSAMQARVPIQPFPFLRTGQKVQITEGPLAGVEGIVMRLKQHFRLVLSVTAVHQGVLRHSRLLGTSLGKRLD
jgi:transcription antitermination factor NusG